MKSRAYTIYLFYETGTALLFWTVFTVNMLYFVTVAQLNALQLVLVGTALEAGIFLFEVPTGVVADMYSRRLSIILGVFLVGGGFILEGLWPSFIPILLAQVLWGVGYTFTSGALQAWISDEIGEENAGAAFLRASQYGQYGALGGTLASMLLGNLQINLPIVAAGLGFCCMGVYLMLVMPENGFRPTPAGERNTWQHLFATLRLGLGMVRRRPALANILWIGLFIGLYSEGFDRLWLASLLSRFELPHTGWQISQVTWIALIEAGGMLLAAGATAALERWGNTGQLRRLVWALSVCCALLVASLAGYALAGSLALAIGLLWAIRVLRDLIAPLYTSWVNQRLDSQVRATVLSLSSQVDALGQIGGGPLIGVVAQQSGLRAGLLGSTLLLAPILGLLGNQIRHGEAE